MAKQAQAQAFGFLSMLRMIKRLKAILASRLSQARAQKAYQDWLSKHQKINSKDNVRIRQWSQLISNPISIAVVMPVYNTKPKWLQEAIDSVHNQLYPHWQLYIIDDCSSDSKIKPILNQAAAKDSRINVIFRETRGHISRCTNTALQSIKTDWVAFLDHDDLLSNDALAWVAHTAHTNPEAMLIYSDEDKIAPNGKFIDPYFKSEWNPILMEGHNMVSHLSAYRQSLITAVGGLRQGLEGAQDHDLTLRCSEKIRRDQIIHIPKVLYHWRIHKKSTSSTSKAKPYVEKSAETAVLEHCRRIKVRAASVQTTRFGIKPIFTLAPKDSPLVSVVIPTRDKLEVLRPCLDSLLQKTTYKQLEVIVVDNGSKEAETISYLSQLKVKYGIKVLRDPGEFNFSRLNNNAVQQASGELICLLNNDIEIIQPDWLDELIAYSQRDNAGAIGPKLIYPNRRIQHAGIILGPTGVACHVHKGLPENEGGYFNRAQLAQEISAVTGACLLVRKKHYLDVGGLNEADLAVALNDVDFCLRLLAHGLHNIYVPSAVLMHHESFSRGYEDTAAKQARFQAEIHWFKRRWKHELVADPSYNPNLSLEGRPFELAWPSRAPRWIDFEDTVNSQY